MILLCFLQITSCKKEQNQDPGIEKNNQQAFSESIQVTSDRSVQLSISAQEQVKQWLAFGAAQDAVMDMKIQSPQQILSSADALQQIMESLRATVPDTLRSNAVKARANVLLTKASLLEQIAFQKNKNPQEIAELSNEIIVAFDNLKLQINELFLQTPETFNLELERETVEYDPIPREESSY